VRYKKRRFLFRRSSAVFFLGSGKLDPKRRTFAGHTFETHGAPHFFCQFLRQGEADPSTIDPGGFRAEPIEGLKQIQMLVFGNSRACIRNAKPQGLRAKPLGVQPNHPAFAIVLHGVGKADGGWLVWRGDGQS